MCELVQINHRCVCVQMLNSHGWLLHVWIPVKLLQITIKNYVLLSWQGVKERKSLHISACYHSNSVNEQLWSRKTGHASALNVKTLNLFRQCVQPQKPPHRTTQHVSVTSHDSQSGMNFDVVSDTHARFPQQMLERRSVLGSHLAWHNKPRIYFQLKCENLVLKPRQRTPLWSKKERTCWQILLLCIYNNSDFKNNGLTNVKQVGVSFILKPKHVPHNRCETLNRIGTWNMYNTVRYMRLDWFLNTLPPFRTSPHANINTKYKVCNKKSDFLERFVLTSAHGCPLPLQPTATALQSSNSI